MAFMGSRRGRRCGYRSSEELHTKLRNGRVRRNPVEVHFSGPALPPTDSGCPTEVRYYTQLIVAYPTSQPPDFPTGGQGGPVSERYNGMPSYRWNGLIPHCY